MAGARRRVPALPSDLRLDDANHTSSDRSNEDNDLDSCDCLRSIRVAGLSAHHGLRPVRLAVRDWPRTAVFLERSETWTRADGARQ